MLLQRFISAATTALVAIKPSPLLQRLRVSEFSTIMIVISVTTSTSCLLGDFDVPLYFLLLLIWVMLIADTDFFFLLRYQQATMSCHFVIIHTNCKCEKKCFNCMWVQHLQFHLLWAKKKKTTNISFRYTGHCFTPKLMCFCQAQCHLTISKYTISRLMEMHPVCYCLLCKLTHAGLCPHKYTPRC